MLGFQSHIRMMTLIPLKQFPDVTFEAFINEKHIGKVHELTGPRLLTFKEVTEEIRFRIHQVI